MKNVVIFIIVILINNLTYGGDMDKIFKAPGAGRWYPSFVNQLENAISIYLSKVKIDSEFKNKKLVAAISPHAGYQFSGLGNAYSYKLLEGKKYKRIFVIGPSHYIYVNKACLLDASIYNTPLGDIKIDTQICNELSKNPNFKFEFEAFQYEHSTDNQIPFIQYVLGNEDIKIIPIIVGEIDLKAAQAIADEIRKYIDDNTFVAISSDFTHYGMNFNYLPFPINDKTRKNLEKLDMGAVEFIKNFDAEGFDDYITKTGATICGRNPIKILLYLFNNKEYDAKLLHYYTSGDENNDYSLSVSYVSLGIFKK